MDTFRTVLGVIALVGILAVAVGGGAIVICVDGGSRPPLWSGYVFAAGGTAMICGGGLLKMFER